MGELLVGIHESSDHADVEDDGETGDDIEEEVEGERVLLDGDPVEDDLDSEDEDEDHVDDIESEIGGSIE